MQYKNEEICELLEISPSTLRGYAILFEKLNYEFKKSQNGHRVYEEKDLVLLQNFIKLKKNNKHLTNLLAANEILKLEQAVINYPSVTDQTDLLIQINENILIYQKEMRDEKSLLQIQIKNLDKKLDKFSEQQRNILEYLGDIKHVLNEAKKSSFMRFLKK